MPLDTNANNARIIGPDGTEVDFDFNPATIVISHTVVSHPFTGKAKPQGGTQQGGAGAAGQPGQSGQSGQPGMMVGDVSSLTAAAGITTIAVRGVTFIGMGVAARCYQLRVWNGLADASASGGSGSGTSTQLQSLPDLTFTWGSQSYTVTLNQLTVSYTRFTPDGDPVRAVVDLTFNEKQTPLSPTNPSSGGLPGRRTHVLTGAESLAGLSTQTYGSPGRWRQIATANGIQDPLRVPPGTLLYLPSAEEDAP